MVLNSLRIIRTVHRAYPCATHVKFSPSPFMLQSGFKLNVGETESLLFKGQQG